MTEDEQSSAQSMTPVLPVRTEHTWLIRGLSILILLSTAAPWFVQSYAGEPRLISGLAVGAGISVALLALALILTARWSRLAPVRPWIYVLMFLMAEYRLIDVLRTGSLAPLSHLNAGPSLGLPGVLGLTAVAAIALGRRLATGLKRRFVFVSVLAALVVGAKTATNSTTGTETNARSGISAGELEMWRDQQVSRALQWARDGRISMETYLRIENEVRMGLHDPGRQAQSESVIAEACARNPDALCQQWLLERKGQTAERVLFP